MASRARLLSSREKRNYRRRQAERLQVVKAERRRENQVAGILRGIDVPDLSQPPGMRTRGTGSLSPAKKRAAGLTAASAGESSAAMAKLMALMDASAAQANGRGGDIDSRRGGRDGDRAGGNRGSLPPLGISRSTTALGASSRVATRGGGAPDTGIPEPAAATRSLPALGRRPYAPVPKPKELGLPSPDGKRVRLKKVGRMLPSSRKPLPMKLVLKTAPVREEDTSALPGEEGGRMRERPKSKSGYRKRHKKAARDRERASRGPETEDGSAPPAQPHHGSPSKMYHRRPVTPPAGHGHGHGESGREPPPEAPAEGAGASAEPTAVADVSVAGGGVSKRLSIAVSGEIGEPDWRMHLTAVDDKSGSQQSALLTMEEAAEALNGVGPLVQLITSRDVDAADVESLLTAAFGATRGGWSHADPVVVDIKALDEQQDDGNPPAEQASDLSVDLGNKVVRMSSIGDNIGDANFRVRVDMTDKAGGFTQSAELTTDEAAGALLGYGGLARTVSGKALDRHDGASLATAAFGERALSHIGPDAEEAAEDISLGADLGDLVLLVRFTGSGVDDPELKLHMTLTSKVRRPGVPSARMAILEHAEAAGALYGFGALSKLMASESMDIADARLLVDAAWGPDVLEAAEAAAEEDSKAAAAVVEAAVGEAGGASDAKQAEAKPPREVFYQGGRKVCGRILMATCFPEPPVYTDGTTGPQQEGQVPMVVIETYDPRVQEQLRLSIPRTDLAWCLFDELSSDVGDLAGVPLLKATEKLLLCRNPHVGLVETEGEAPLSPAEAYHMDHEPTFEYAQLVAAWPVLLARDLFRRAMVIPIEAGGERECDVACSLLFLPARDGESTVAGLPDDGAAPSTGIAGLAADAEGLHLLFQLYEKGKVQESVAALALPLSSVALDVTRDALVNAAEGAAERLELGEGGELVLS